MCYQDEVHEATETETDEFNLTPEQTKKLISDYEDFIRQMESLKEKEEPVATAEPEETAEEPTAEKQTTSEETEEEPITEENTKVTEAEEKFSETYKKNAESQNDARRRKSARQLEEACPHAARTRQPLHGHGSQRRPRSGDARILERV